MSTRRTVQEAWWQGDGGTQYVDRNRVDWEARRPFWAGILSRFGPINDILEVGCGSGWNLLAIRSVKGVPFGKLAGCDINDQAIAEAQGHDLAVDKVAAADVLEHYGRGQFDLVFTAGVLIHIKDVAPVMAAIKQVSRGLVLSIEYEAEAVTDVVYRGQTGLLWKRPYGAMFESMNLEVLGTGEAEGFDRCQWTMLRKP